MFDQSQRFALTIIISFCTRVQPVTCTVFYQTIVAIMYNNGRKYLSNSCSFEKASTCRIRMHLKTIGIEGKKVKIKLEFQMKYFQIDRHFNGIHKDFP